MKMMLKIGNRLGVTLVEVLLAVVILSVGVAGVLQAYAASLKTLEIVQESVDVINFSKIKMAEVEESSIEAKGISAGLSNGTLMNHSKEYQWQLQVNPIAIGFIHEVDLTVSRQDGTRPFTLVTYEDNKDYVEEED